LSGFVDIHAHVLPGIDDGPADMEGALAMLRAAEACGIATICATPHVRTDFPDVHIDELAGRVQALRDAAERESIGVQIVGGAEVSLVWALEASRDELTLVSYGQLGKDLLVETPASTVTGLARMLYGLQARGLRVTLAHPERSPEFQRDRSPLEELVRQGVLLQVNADALLARGRAKAVRRLARGLCRDSLAHVIASDGHRAASWRPVTALGVGADVAASFLGAPQMEWMAQRAPAAILAGAELPGPPGIDVGRGLQRLLRRR
jgi:protein-tyrosine phosphatase